MEGNKATYRSIDEYISGFPPETQAILQTLRRLIKEAAPEAEETISYQMPAFTQNGILVYFAAHKNHIGFYPTASGIETFKGEFASANYAWSKGAVQFPTDKPLPSELITRIVRFKLDENSKKAEGKRKKK